MSNPSRQTNSKALHNQPVATPGDGQALARAQSYCLSLLLAGSTWFGRAFLVACLFALLLFPVLKQQYSGLAPVAVGVCLALALLARPIREWLTDRLMSLSTTRFLLFVVVAGVAARAGAILVFPREPAVDPYYYHVYALQLLAGEYYGSPGARAFFPPGMSMLLAAWYKATQPAPLLGQILNTLFGVVMILQLHWLGNRVFDRRVARWAAVMTALLPTFVFYTATLGHDLVLAVIMLATAQLAILQSDTRAQRFGVAVAFGLLCGFGSLVKPICLLLPFLALVYWAVVDAPRQALAKCALAFFVMLLAVAPWTVRNYRVLGAFVPVSTNAGYCLWHANTEFDSREQADRIEAEMRRLEEVERDRKYGQMARQGIRENPARLAKLVARKFVFMWGTSSSLMSIVSYDRMVPWQENVSKAVLNVAWTGLLVLCAVATFRWNPWCVRFMLPLTGLLFYIFALHLVFDGFSRYHIPVVGVLILVAANALTADIRPGAAAD